MKRRDRCAGGSVNASFHVHGVCTACHQFQAFMQHGLGEYGRGAGAITDLAVGAAGHFLNHLGAHVLKAVLQLEAARDCVAVFGNVGRGCTVLEDDVSSSGSECDAHCAGQYVDAGQHAIARLDVE